mmetsp:Transcript_53693/g.65826  ORF Transcript_53693/g.65826 Transcript_53693/m.65826 type:complete len:171 (-) Transcript_53693:110-622(-)
MYVMVREGKSKTIENLMTSVEERSSSQATYRPSVTTSLLTPNTMQDGQSKNLADGSSVPLAGLAPAAIDAGSGTEPLLRGTVTAAAFAACIGPAVAVVAALDAETTEAEVVLSTVGLAASLSPSMSRAMPAAPPREHLLRPRAGCRQSMGRHEMVQACRPELKPRVPNAR